MEIEKYIAKSTSLRSVITSQFQNRDDKKYTPICFKTEQECPDKQKGSCNKIHFNAIIANNTDSSLGDCSYLNTCFKGKNCRYVHYHISLPESLNHGKTRSPKNFLSDSFSIPWTSLTFKPVSFQLNEFYQTYISYLYFLDLSNFPIYQFRY